MYQSGSINGLTIVGWWIPDGGVFFLLINFSGSPTTRGITLTEFTLQHRTEFTLCMVTRAFRAFAGFEGVETFLWLRDMGVERVTCLPFVHTFAGHLNIEDVMQFQLLGCMMCLTYYPVCIQPTSISLPLLTVFFVFFLLLISMSTNQASR